MLETHCTNPRMSCVDLNADSNHHFSSNPDGMIPVHLEENDNSEVLKSLVVFNCQPGKPKTPQSSSCLWEEYASPRRTANVDSEPSTSCEKHLNEGQQCSHKSSKAPAAGCVWEYNRSPAINRENVTRVDVSDCVEPESVTVIRESLVCKNQRSRKRSMPTVVENAKVKASTAPPTVSKNMSKCFYEINSACNSLESQFDKSLAEYVQHQSSATQSFEKKEKRYPMLETPLDGSLIDIQKTASKLDVFTTSQSSEKSCHEIDIPMQSDKIVDITANGLPSVDGNKPHLDNSATNMLCQESCVIPSQQLNEKSFINELESTVHPDLVGGQQPAYDETHVLKNPDDAEPSIELDDFLFAPLPVRRSSRRLRRTSLLLFRKSLGEADLNDSVEVTDQLADVCSSSSNQSASEHLSKSVDEGNASKMDGSTKPSRMYHMNHQLKRCDTRQSVDASCANEREPSASNCAELDACIELHSDKKGAAKPRRRRSLVNLQSSGSLCDNTLSKAMAPCDGTLKGASDQSVCHNDEVSENCSYLSNSNVVSNCSSTTDRNTNGFETSKIAFNSSLDSGDGKHQESSNTASESQSSLATRRSLRRSSLLPVMKLDNRVLGKGRRKKVEPSLEEIYCNRLWRSQMPKERTWESIPESPIEDAHTGCCRPFAAHKVSGMMKFEDAPNQTKVRQRRQKAIARGWKPLTKKRIAALDRLLARKLAELESDVHHVDDANV